MAEPWERMAPHRVGAPSTGDRARLHRLVDDVLDRNWLTNHGPLEREFEDRLRDVVGTAHCIPVANATLGLLVAVHTLMGDGDVLMPSFTFPAAAHVTRMLGRRPVFCDIEASTHQVDPLEVAAQVGADTAGLIATHLWGRACDTRALVAALGDRPVVFDAAHAFGAAQEGRPVGGNGSCEVFSFHATKFVTAAEGGAIATDDDELADRLRLAINFGYSGRDQVDDLGLNAKMSELHAALGLVSLDLMDEIAAANRAHLEQYQQAVASLPGVDLVAGLDRGNASFVVVEIDEGSAGLDRDAVMGALHRADIDARRYFHPGVHRMAPHLDSGVPCDLPVTDAVCRRVLQLPTGLDMTDDDVGTVCRTLARIIAG